MNLRIFDSKDELARGMARAIAERALNDGSDGAVIALSGGSTPVPVYEILGRDDALRERRVIWVVVDERYVPEDDTQSNSAMIRRTLFARGIAPAHRFLRFKTELNDPEATAREFEREWHDLGIEKLDAVVLGIGDDGHTASLFPGTDALNVEDRIATPVFVEKLDMWRVTITKPVIRAASLRMVEAAGEPKRDVLRAIREGADYPIAQATSGVETWWFLDRAAAP
ncbi:MAG TPA: 6-phosphogluconolactonase [Thermoanaerobaculia bacterium]|jgi:6-phosphogluconolactonase|nr:6-phosphogluconolactonase [Thermoanaerobaculia bacterium]